MEEDQKSNNRKKYLRLLAIWAGISVFFLIEFIYETYPDYPKSPSGWLILILVGPPIWLLVNILGEKFIGRPTAKVINKLGEKRLRNINIVLASVIIIPVVLMILLFVTDSIFHYLP